MVVTCARGSSGQCRRLFQICAGDPHRHPRRLDRPSVASIYRAPLRLDGALVISVSQSGKSSDIVGLQAAARQAGAFAVAVVNVADSPPPPAPTRCCALHAGVETSVAATKTFLASATVPAALVAEWADDAGLRAALRKLPEALRRAVAADWSRGAAGAAGGAIGLMSSAAARRCRWPRKRR